MRSRTSGRCEHGFIMMANQAPGSFPEISQGFRGNVIARLALGECQSGILQDLRASWDMGPDP